MKMIVWKEARVSLSYSQSFSKGAPGLNLFLNFTELNSVVLFMWACFNKGNGQR